MSILLERFLRNKIIGDLSSPLLHYLRAKPGNSRTLTLKQLATRIEKFGSLSKEDVDHVVNALTWCIVSALTNGDKVKMDGLGTFYTTFNCKGVEEEKDCTVRNIRRVNIRFRVDNSIRLVNETHATTREAENNVKFEIVKSETDSGSSTGGNGGNNNNGGGNNGGGDDNGGGDNGGGWVDPSD